MTLSHGLVSTQLPIMLVRRKIAVGDRQGVRRQMSCMDTQPSYRWLMFRLF